MILNSACAFAGRWVRSSRDAQPLVVCVEGRAAECVVLAAAEAAEVDHFGHLGILLRKWTLRMCGGMKLHGVEGLRADVSCGLQDLMRQ